MEIVERKDENIKKTIQYDKIEGNTVFPKVYNIFIVLTLKLW